MSALPVAPLTAVPPHVQIFDLPPRKRDRCLQEVHLLRQLSHPHIMAMIDAFIDGSQLVIVCEWAPGGDLKQLLRRAAEAGRPLPEAQVWACFAQCAEGLQAMHAARIMHRDVKPANVLLGASGLLKLGDLGLGRQLSQDTVKLLSKVGAGWRASRRGLHFTLRACSPADGAARRCLPAAAAGGHAVLRLARGGAGRRVRLEQRPVEPGLPALRAGGAQVAT